MIYAIILPLAVFIGWMAVDLANWDRTSFATFVAIIFVLLLPALLKWHYPVLILSWNIGVTVFFLPGQPAMWMLMAAINVGIAVLNRIMEKRQAFLSAPAITISLIALSLVVIVTAKLRGGIGLTTFGSQTVGGKGYVFIVGAILGYFALISQSIPVERAKMYLVLFFLPGAITAVGSHLIYYAGSAFYFLYLIFPVGFAAGQAATEYTGGAVRLGGFCTAAFSTLYYLMARNGVRGILKKWWGPLAIVILLGLGCLGGFRSFLILFVVVFLILFTMEGLFRSSFFPILLLSVGLGLLLTIPFAAKLPLSVQRTLSFLPIEIDPLVRSEAQGSVDWRIQMWRVMLPELPKYIWLGKGYAVDSTELYLAQEAQRRQMVPDDETALVTGDYHSGPLSLYVPLGSFGAIAFLAFLIASLRGLYLNYRYGCEELRKINRFLFAYFAARVIFFFAIFGGFYSDLYQFVGVVGLGLAFNKGICRKPALAPKPVTFHGPLLSEPVQSKLA